MSTDNIVHITNLTPEITVQHIQQTYQKCGTITKIIMGRHEALVFFLDEDEANGALVFTSICNVDVDLDISEVSTLPEIVEEVNFSESQEQEEEKPAHNNQDSTADASNVQNQSHISKDGYEYITKNNLKQEEHSYDIVQNNVVEQQSPKQEVHEAPAILHEPIVEAQHVVAPAIEKVVEEHIEESQGVVEQPKVEEPKVVEQARVEEPKVVEQPQVVEEPKVVEEHKVVEQPKVFEQPKVVEQSRVVEEPKQVKTEQPLAQVAESKPAVCPYSNATDSSNTATPSSCPFAAGTTTCPSTSSSTSTLDSVQLLKTLKNTSLPERTKPSSTDLFSNVLNQTFVTGLLGLLVVSTVFSSIF